MGRVKWPLLGAIFDLDGTMIDSHDLQYDFHKYIATHPDFGDMRRFPRKGRKFWDEYNEAYAEGGLSGLYGRYGKITPENFDAMYPAIEDQYAVFIRNFKKSPTVNIRGDDVADAVRTIWERGALSEKRDMRLRLAVNTTKEKRNAQALLERADIWQYFDTSVTYDDMVKYAANGEAKKRNITNIPDDVKELRKFLAKDTLKSLEKPNALSSMVTLYRMGLSADRVIVFEDTPTGIYAAKNVPLPQGMEDLYVVGVTWGYEKNPAALRKAGADQIITRPSQMVEIVDSMGGFS
jgi:phosphoglycolate phosphatase-like HAD superfamily hydrolase